MTVHEGRVRRPEDAAAAIAETRPDRVVCALGRTHTANCATIDCLEGDDEETWKDLVLANLQAPIWICQAAAKAGPSPIPVLYVGTGCIYTCRSGDLCREALFTEEDAPNFHGSAYSRIKALTDSVLGNDSNVLTARIRMPVADFDSGRDLICKLWSYPTICNDAPNSLTVLSDVLPALLALAHAGRTGVFNAVNPGALTHEEILKVFREEAFRCHPHRTVDEPRCLGLRAQRSVCSLSSSKLEAALGDLPRALLRLYYRDVDCYLPAGGVALSRIAKLRCSPSEGGSRRGRRLLVTGGSGFIASHFINVWLSKFEEDRIVNVDNLDPASDADECRIWASCEAAPRELRDRYSRVHLDLSDVSSMAELLALMTTHEIQDVVHMAARTHVDDSFHGPTSVRYTQVNVLGTHHLLEACREYIAVAPPGSFRRFLHMSTDEVYGESMEDAGAHEGSTVLDPTNPYAATKAGAEHLVRAYGHSHKLPYVIVRCNNVYGTHQSEKKVISRFCNLALKGEALTLHGRGETTRCFIHTSDVMRAVGMILCGWAPLKSFDEGLLETLLWWKDRLTPIREDGN